MAAEGSVLVPRVKTRTVGAPISNICTFQADVLPGVNFAAYTLSDGCIVLQQAVPGPEALNSVPPEQQRQPQGPGGDSGAGGSSSGQFLPVLLINLQGPGSEQTSEACEKLAWGGGPAYLLAAANKQHVHIFSLRHYFLHEAAGFVQATWDAAAASHAAAMAQAGGDAAGAAQGYGIVESGSQPSLPLPSSSWQLVASYRLSAPLLAMDWTLRADGLLLSDAAHSVTMLEIEVHGLDSLYVAQGGLPEVMVREAWSAHSDAAHPLAAAGLGPGTPCATAHSRAAGGTNAPGSGSTSQQHRVIVWWPKPITKEPGKAGGAHAGGMGSGGGEGSGGHKFSIGAEVIRHPVRVVSLQWSPPLGTEAVPGPAADGPEASGGSGAGSAAAGAGAASPPGLALMTVGADWAIRIFVEVQMRDLLPAGMGPGMGAAAVAALSMSQFCLALVIEPPLPSLTPHAYPGLRAAWARPLPPPTHHGAKQPAGHAMQGAQPYSAALPIASRVHWVVASVAVHHPPPYSPGPQAWSAVSPLGSGSRPSGVGPLAGASPSSHGSWLEETVCVWAVDGLGGVTLSGLPRGAVQASKGAGGPRAVLWGRAGGHVTWLQPQEVCLAQDLRLATSAYVLYPAFVPVIHAADAFTSTAGAYAEVRSYAAATVTQDAGNAACPHTGIRLHGLCRQPLPGCPDEVRSLILAPSLSFQGHATDTLGLGPLAATLDKAGALGMWCLDPVEELPLVQAEPSPHSRLLPSSSSTRVPGQAGDAAFGGLLNPLLSGHITALTWLSLPSPGSITGAGASASARVGAAAEGGPVQYLASTVGGYLYVHALQLPGIAGPPPAAGEAAAKSWKVQVLGELLQLPLPAEYASVSQVLEVIPSAVSGAWHGGGRSTGHAQPIRFQLLGLAARAGTSDGGSLMGISAGGAVAHAWLSWQLEFVPSATRDHPWGKAYLVSQQVLSMQDWVMPGPGASSSAQGPALGPIACCHMPGRTSQLAVTGTAAGKVLVWHLDDSAQQPPQLTSVLPCRPPRELWPGLAWASPSSSPIRGSESGIAPGALGHALEQARASQQQQLLALPVSVAAQEAAGLLAAATTCGLGDAEDALFIWRRRYTGSGSSNTRSTSRSSGGASFAAGCSEAAAGDWTFDAVVPLGDTASAVAWVPAGAGALTPMLVVGYASGVVSYVVRRRGSSTSEWLAVAQSGVGSGLPGPSSMLALPDGCLAVASGKHIAVLANVSEEDAAAAAAAAASSASPATVPPPPTLTRVAADLCGNLPPCHPALLSALLRKGRLATACQLLRALLVHVKACHQRLEAEEEGSDAGTLPEGSAPSVSIGEDGTVSKGQAGYASSSRGLPRFSFPLSQLLQQELQAAPAISALQQLASLPAAPPSALAKPAPAPPLPQPKPAPAEQPASSAPAAAVPVAPKPAAPATPAKSALDSGILDMSAFGAFGGMAFGGGMGAAEPALPLPPKTPEPAAVQAPETPQPPAPVSSIDTGMLDMSAFGDFGGFGGAVETGVAAAPEPEPPTPHMQGEQQAEAAPGPAAAASSAWPSQASGMETGMLDMSAFGGFMGDYGAAVSEPKQPSMPVAQVSMAQLAQAAVTSPAATTSMLDTGMLSMAAFGDFGVSTTASPPPPPPPPPEDLDSMPLAARKLKQMLAGGSNADGAVGGAASAAKPGEAGSQQAAADPNIVLFPRMHAPAGPGARTGAAAAGSGAAGSGPSAQHHDDLAPLLFTKEEVASLQELLGVVLPSQQPLLGAGSTIWEGPAGASRTASLLLPQQSLLPSYLQDDDGSAAVAARAARVRQSLGLEASDALRLSCLARALTRALPVDPNSDAAGGTASSSFSSMAGSSSALATTAAAAGAAEDSGVDVMGGLDAPGRAFLAAARLAAAEEELGLPAEGEAEAGGPEGRGTAEDRFSKVLSQVFRPVAAKKGQGSDTHLARGITTESLGGDGYDRMPAQDPVQRPLQKRPGASAGGSGLNLSGLATLGKKPAVGTPGHTRNKSMSLAGSSGAASAYGAASKSRTSVAASGLSLASLPEADPDASDRAVAAQARGKAARSWTQFLGLLRSLRMPDLLWAAASGAPGALLDAALPSVPWRAQEEVLAAPDAGRGNSFAPTSLSSSSRPPIAWPMLRKLGAGLWFTDLTALRAKAEALARAQFARHKDPYECMLLYLALGKRSMLATLFRQVNNRKLVDFLSKDFSSEDTLRAAAKNAYALLGQHKYDMAASFFLLANCTSDAIGVLARERGDPQLALLVARLTESNNGSGPGGAGMGPGGVGGVVRAGPGALAMESVPLGPAGSQLVKEELMPLAEACGDPGAVALVLWTEGKRPEAVQHLVAASARLRGLGPPGQDAAGAAGALSAMRPSSFPVTVDPCALDWVVQCGVYQLSGRPVPRTLGAAVGQAALASAEALEGAGLAAAALEALRAGAALLQGAGQQHSAPQSALSGFAATAVTEQGQCQQDGSGLSPGAALALQQAYMRLVASCLALWLPPSPSPPQPALVEQQLEQLHAGGLAGPLLQLASQPVSQQAAPVLAALGEYWACMQAAQRQLLLPPWSVRYSQQLLLQSHVLGSSRPGSPPSPFPGGSQTATPRQSGTQPVVGGALLQQLVAQQQLPLGANRSASNSGSLPVSALAAAGALGSVTGPPSTVAGAGASGYGYKHSNSFSSGPPSITSAPVSPSPSLTHAHSMASLGLASAPSGTTGMGVGGGTAAPAPARTGAEQHAGDGAGSLFGPPIEVISVEGDKCHAVACCSARGAAATGRAGTGTRPVAVALAKGGILTGETPAQSGLEAGGGAAGASGWGGWGSGGGASSSFARQGSLLMGLIGQVLEHVRWTPDPWAAVASQVTAGAGPSGSGPSSSRGYGDGSGSGSLIVGGEHELPASSQQQHLYAMASATHAICVAPHPDRDYFISGSHSDHVFLWRFGEPRSCAAYVPVLDPAGGAGPGAGLGAGGPGGRKQLLLELLQTPHWEGAARVVYARSGTRFAGVGEGGVVALWRQDLAPSARGLGFADWVHHCVAKRGHDLSLLGDSGSQLLVCGRGDRGGVVSWWDTLAPGTSQCVAEVSLPPPGGHTTSGGRVRGGGPEIGCLQLVAGSGAGTLVVVGDEHGDINVLDLRMLGAQRPVWSLPRAHSGPVLCMSSWSHEPQYARLSVPRPRAARPSPALASAPPTPSGSVHNFTSRSGGVGSGGGAPQGGPPAAAAAAGPGSGSGPAPGPHSLYAGAGGGGSSAGPAGGAAAGAAAGVSAAGLQLPPYVPLSDLVVTGGRDGSIVVVDVSHGVVVQAMDKAHWQVKRNPLGALFGVGTGANSAAASPRGGLGAAGPPPNAVGVAVTSLTCCDAGLLSCGMDGVVRCHQLAALPI